MPGRLVLARFGGGSALPRGLGHEGTDLRRHPRALAGWAPDLALLPLRDGHGQLERFLTFLTDERVSRHGGHPPVSMLHVFHPSVIASRRPAGHVQPPISPAAFSSRVMPSAPRR